MLQVQSLVKAVTCACTVEQLADLQAPPGRTHQRQRQPSDLQYGIENDAEDKPVLILKTLEPRSQTQLLLEAAHSVVSPALCRSFLGQLQPALVGLCAALACPLLCLAM